jgi:hypothetical protein
MIKPFPKEWLQRFDEAQLERLAIMTNEGGLSDSEAERFLLSGNSPGVFQGGIRDKGFSF